MTRGRNPTGLRPFIIGPVKAGQRHGTAAKIGGNMGGKSKKEYINLRPLACRMY